jgi:hypothetical protein
MKIGKDNFFHLTYCSNIHAGESWQEVFANLQQYIPPLKATLAPQQPFGIGLRLSNLAATELLMNDSIDKFKYWLAENQLYVFTINGFVYGGFHKQRVKEQVYTPDWSTTTRQDYNLKLIKILAALTPNDGESGFSTSPLSYKPLLNFHEGETIFRTASIHLAQLVAEMVLIYQQENKLLHVDIEPEPDCLLESTEEVINFFQKWLLPLGSRYLINQLHISPAQAESYIRRHIRVCYDLCHLSLQFEKPEQIFKRFIATGIQIGKIQISSALKINIPNETTKRKNLIDCLKQFADSVYLHQVIARHANNKLEHYPDLEAALTKIETTQTQEWRIHFHVPMFLEHYQTLQSTQSDIVAALKLLQQNKVTRHLEIETYTWDVLPKDLKIDLATSLQREYQWVLNQFQT